MVLWIKKESVFKDKLNKTVVKFWNNKIFIICEIHILKEFGLG